MLKPKTITVVLLFAVVLIVFPLTIQGVIAQPSSVFAPRLIVPEPDATDVPLNTTIVISWKTLPPIQQLSLTPEVQIAKVTNTSDPATSTFTLAELLKPSTTYNVTITYGSFAVVSSQGNATWGFTTAKPTAAQTPSVFDALLALANDIYDIARDHWWAVIIGVIVIIAIIAAATKLTGQVERISLEGARRIPSPFYHNPHKNYPYMYKGAVHVHSTRSAWHGLIGEGWQPPDVVIRRHFEKGYKFIFLTDHNIVSSPDVPQVDGILYIRNYKSLECGRNYGHHILALGIDPALIEEYHREKPDMGRYLDPEKDGQVNLETRRCGNALYRLAYYSYIGMAVLAHPHGQHGTELLDSGWSLSELLNPMNRYIGMEIFTSASAGDSEQPLCTDWWDEVLTRERPVWGFGADDCHNPIGNFKSFNRAWIVVNSAKPFEDSVEMERDIIDNIKAGNFYTVVRSPEIRGLTPSDGSNNIGPEFAIRDQGDKIIASTSNYRRGNFMFYACSDSGVMRVVTSYATSAAAFRAEKTDKYVRVVMDQTGENGELYRVFSQPLFVIKPPVRVD